MREIPQALLDEFKKGYYRPATLIDIAGDMFITDWASPLYYQGDIYYPRGMRRGPIRSGSSNVVDSFSFELDDVNREAFKEISEKNPAGISYSQHLIVMDRDQQILSGTTIYTGFLDSWDYTPSTMKITIVSIFVQWNRETTKYFSSSCRWQLFKGIECKYDGQAIVCDRSYGQCKSYSNSDNFGGFRWLPTLVDKRLRLRDTTDDPPKE